MSLSGRRILVTGASSGIGAATARACTAVGAQVAVVARREERLRGLADEIGAVPVPADLTDEDAAREAVERAAAELGGLDALVNNAGMVRPSLVSEGKVDEWRAMFELNVLALLVVTHTALPHLRDADHADIVNVSSRSGRRVPSAPGGVYSATKFAVHAISDGLRQELQDEGIRVTVVAPGLVRTEIFDGVTHEDADRLRQAAQERGIDPADVAAQIVHALGQPSEVLLREIVLSHVAQDS